jgi:hypothetical protein
MATPKRYIERPDRKCVSHLHSPRYLLALLRDVQTTEPENALLESFNGLSPEAMVVTEDFTDFFSVCHRHQPKKIWREKPQRKWRQCMAARGLYGFAQKLPEVPEEQRPENFKEVFVWEDEDGQAPSD